LVVVDLWCNVSYGIRAQMGREEQNNTKREANMAVEKVDKCAGLLNLSTPISLEFS
jgi:hypothetical protein